MQLALATPVAAVLILLVWRAREGREGATPLIAMLAFEGVAMLLWSSGRVIGGPVSDSFAALAVMFFASSAVTYMLVLRTLRTRMTRPFGSIWVVVVVALICVGPALFSNIQSLLVGSFPPFRNNVLHEDARGLLGSLVTTTLMSMYALIASIVAWARADRESPSRKRAGAFALAFGTRDSVFTVAVMGTILLGYYGPEYQAYAMLLWPVASMLYMPLVVFAILRLQLLDIELHAKVTIKGGTMAALVGGLMLVGSEVIETVFDIEQWYSAVAIGLIAAMLAKPIGQFGARVADRMLPGVEDTPQYRTVRACELYRSALEDSMRDGTITERERNMLNRMAENLELPSETVRRIEAAAQPG